MVPQTDRKQKGVIRSLDWWTVVIYLALLTFGWVSVCGASYSYGETDIFSLDTRSGMQIIWIATSIVLGFVLLMLDDRYYDMFSFFIYGFMVVLLFATIFNPHSIKGSRSWLVMGPLRLQPAEFAKFATALALAKVMSIYGYNIQKWRHFAAALGIIFLPMIFIVLQRETGSALVYLAFFMMFYREGMPGSILFTGVAMVFYFVVGIRFADTMILYTPTSVGKFVVLLFVQIFAGAMVWIYCSDKKESLRILGICVGMSLIGLLFSLTVIPFNVVYVELTMCVLLVCYLLLRSLSTRIRNYLWIAAFTVGSVVFFNLADYMLNNVMEAHQRVRINVLLGLEEDLRGAGYNVHRRPAAVPGIDSETYLPVRATTLSLWTCLWLLCAEHLPIPPVYQCRYGTGTDTRHRYSAAVLQLWRFVALGLHDSAVHLPAYRCRQEYETQLRVYCFVRLIPTSMTPGIISRFIQ